MVAVVGREDGRRWRGEGKVVEGRVEREKRG